MGKVRKQRKQLVESKRHIVKYAILNIINTKWWLIFQKQKTIKAHEDGQAPHRSDCHSQRVLNHVCQISSQSHACMAHWAFWTQVSKCRGLGNLPWWCLSLCSPARQQNRADTKEQGLFPACSPSSPIFICCTFCYPSPGNAKFHPLKSRGCCS